VVAVAICLAGITMFSGCKPTNPPDNGKSLTITVTGIDAAYYGNFYGFGINTVSTAIPPKGGSIGAYISNDGTASAVVKHSDGTDITDVGPYYIWIVIYKKGENLQNPYDVTYFRTVNMVTLTLPVTTLTFNDFQFDFKVGEGA